MNAPAGLQVLRHSDVRLFILGQGTSQIGNWVQLVATSWLVYQLSGSTLLLGLATFCQQIPFLVLTPVAGVLLDRLDLKRVLMATTALAIAQSLVLLWLDATGRMEAWHLVAASLVLGIGNAFEVPARQALLPRLLPERNELAHAIALNSTVMNGARFIGPMVGGVITATLGHLWVFAINSVLRAAVLFVLAAMRLAALRSAENRTGLLDQLMAGVRYAYGYLPSRHALVLLAVSSFCLQSYSSMLPWFAAERFHGDSRTLGIMMSCAGLGAVSGMVYLASRRSIRGLFRVLGWSAAAASAAVIGFSYATTLAVALPMLFVAAGGMMITAAATNTVLHTIVPDELRGRVAALYVMAFLGMSPLGSLFTGWSARFLGAPNALALCGVVSLVAAGVYARGFDAIRREIIPLYERLEIPRARDPDS